MDDLISRAAAIDAVNEYLRLSEVSKTVQNMTSIQAVLRWLPSAQPEIVRCKDCKHYENDVMGNPWGVCCHPDWIINNCGSLVDQNGWCYRAERRTDEHSNLDNSSL